MEVAQNQSPEPIFPPELERAIFEFAARSCPTKIPTLMQTAWRVKHWVEPLLYRVIHISSTPARQMSGFPIVPIDVLVQAILNKRSALLNAVEFLFLENMPLSPAGPIVDVILLACPRLTNLFSSIPLSNLQGLASLRRLRRLAVDTTDLLHPHPADFTPPLFGNVTHFELLDVPPGPDASRYADLVLIPSLTHISFNCKPLLHELYPLLERRTRLEYIVLLSPDLHPHRVMRQIRHSDERFVQIGQTNFRADWFSSARGGRDYWDLAEAFIAARRAGRVPRSVYSISDTDKRYTTRK
ncbi:hypothetical protein K438DRAFT_1823871 [Mycena galopus ATCC 62051]|nr:hypothetical protein K438DRAFT_1823871 [Mycena galopus ATCC 62051]